MAVEVQSKLDFISVLSNISRKFDIIHTKWTDNKLFEAKFRTQISRLSQDYNALCDEWVNMFSEVTATTWVNKISNTGPKIRFRKQYQCWTMQGEVQKELLFDTRRCKGTLDVKVLTDNPQTRRKNKYIKLGLNVVIKVNFIHLHVVDVNQPYSFFAHNCIPLLEAPKPIILPNDKLPKMIADIVEKGRLLSHKPTIHKHKNIINMNGTITTLSDAKLECVNLLEDDNIGQLSLIQFEQIDGMSPIKLHIESNQLQDHSTQLDMSTLMYDPSQVIPDSEHSLTHHFEQGHTMHNNQTY